jgi:peptide/nickel transport system ATP-binding protein
MDPDRRTTKAPLAGDPPNPIDPPSGCRFHTRCPLAEEPCRRAEPGLKPAGDRRLVACHMNDPASGHSRAGRQGDAA